VYGPEQFSRAGEVLQSEIPAAAFWRMAASYRPEMLIALSKMVGLEVSPVTERVSMYCRSAPLFSRARVMLSSHRLCPRSCNSCVDFISPPDIETRDGSAHVDFGQFIIHADLHARGQARMYRATL
jgi:hypothetical protein